MRHPLGAGAKQIEVQIGPYGKGAGKWSLKKARDEWDRIRVWSKDTGNDPRELKKRTTRRRWRKRTLQDARFFN